MRVFYTETIELDFGAEKNIALSHFGYMPRAHYIRALEIIRHRIKRWFAR